MTHTEFRSALATLELSQAGAARLLGVNERTARRWASDEQEIPPPVARFLRLLIARKITPAQALRALGLPE